MSKIGVNCRGYQEAVEKGHNFLHHQNSIRTDQDRPFQFLCSDRTVRIRSGDADPFMQQFAFASSIRSPVFTEEQWKELERQAMIFKYLLACVPVPPHLLLGRCRRTDGKKWRCSRLVAAPQQKYCHRHLHRGRGSRSRKPVELSFHPYPTTNTSAAKNIGRQIPDAVEVGTKGLGVGHTSEKEFNKSVSTFDPTHTFLAPQYYEHLPRNLEQNWQPLLHINCNRNSSFLHHQFEKGGSIKPSMGSIDLSMDRTNYIDEETSQTQMGLGILDSNYNNVDDTKPQLANWLNPLAEVLDSGSPFKTAVSCPFDVTHKTSG